MPWNGSGSFLRIYSWQADAAAGIDIVASRMDGDTDNITNNGFSNCLTRDGQGSATALLPMNGFRHTGAGPAVNTGDYITLGQISGTATLSADFINGNFSGTLVAGTFAPSSINAAGLINAGTVIATGGITGATLTSGGLIQGATVFASGGISTNGTISGAALGVTGALTAGQITSAGSVAAQTGFFTTSINTGSVEVGFLGSNNFGMFMTGTSGISTNTGTGNTNLTAGGVLAMTGTGLEFNGQPIITNYTGFTPGTYGGTAGALQLTIDQYGRIKSISTVAYPAASSGGSTSGGTGSGGTEGGGGGCFLAGSLVLMADGNYKPIEEVRVGEYVSGASGEANQVLALHRPLLGFHPLYIINGHHVTSANHPHLRANMRGFLACDVTDLDRVWGSVERVITEAGEEHWRNVGMRRDRVVGMKENDVLMTTSGWRNVGSIRRLEMAPETQLYNLVLAGSHTYSVNSYWVTGWPREDDFDYDKWTARALTLA